MILVVDDHEDTRYVLLRLLRRTGHEAVGVRDGNEALQFLQTRRPAMMILDCNMPCLDGFDVLRAVRASGPLSGLPVLMFSADRGSRERALGLGANGFVLKGSLDWDQLSAAMEAILSGPASPGPEPKADSP